MDRQEAIQIIKNNWPNGRNMLSEALEFLIPELKESEDERIRKALKSFFDSEISDYGNVEWRNGIRYGEIVAWLEKQGEQKQNITNLISDLENYFATTTKEQQEKDWEEIKKWEEKHFNHNKHIEQKPEWSEEDERMCQETIDWFEKKCFPYALESENPARESIKWLKSLEQRMKG